MEMNNLYSIALSDAGISDEQILEAFVNAKMPDRVQYDLRKFVSILKGPVAVRSSSVLEDSRYQPFAGIYATYMVPRSKNIDELHHQLCSAIKCVYASAFV